MLSSKSVLTDTGRTILAAISSNSGCLSSVVLSYRNFHTSSVDNSRIKRCVTHKPFWHIKKTNKQPDDPITADNLDFIEMMKQYSYVNSRPAALEALGSTAAQGTLKVKTSPLKSELEPWPRGQWKDVTTTRCGLIGRKIGVVPLWLKSGKRILSTMVQIEDNHVIKYIPPEKFAQTVLGERRAQPRVFLPNKSISRGCLVIGALSGDPTKFTKDYCGLFTETGLMPKKKLVRMPVSEEAIIQPGTQLHAAHFQPGQWIDILGRSARRGFHGVMKRWGFAGGPADSHGSTKFHRRPGCIGSGRDKGRVWPGQKLPGHVGNTRVKMLGLQIMRINYEHNILYIRGCAVPGEQGEFVQIFDSKHNEKRLKESPRFFPTAYEEDLANLPEEEYASIVHNFEEPSITFT